MRIWLTSVYLAAMLSASPARAQQVQDDKGIVVTGQSQPSAKVVRRFVRQISDSIDGQLARFAAPVCPLVLGLPEAFARSAEQRIRDVAAAGGVPHGERGCEVNVALIVAKDADGLVKALRKKHPGFFAGLDDGALRRALRQGPAHAWSTIEVHNEDGQTVGMGDDGMKVLEVRSASRITLPTQQVTVQSIVVLDADSTLGKLVIQLADYAAMRALAGALPPRESAAADTILTLYDPALPPPPELTAVDLGFLKGLYKASTLGRSTAQRDVISREVVKEVRQSP